jgi:hypothetical protein
MKNILDFGLTIIPNTSSIVYPELSEELFTRHNRERLWNYTTITYSPESLRSALNIPGEKEFKDATGMSYQEIIDLFTATKPKVGKFQKLKNKIKKFFKFKKS